MSGGKKKRAAARRLHREIRDTRKLIEEGVPAPLSEDGKTYVAFAHPSVAHDLREVRAIDRAAWNKLKK